MEFGYNNSNGSHSANCFKPTSLHKNLHIFVASCYSVLTPLQPFVHTLNRQKICVIQNCLGDIQEMQRQDASAELDPLAQSIDQGEAPLLLTSASPQRVPQRRASKAASATSSLATTPMLLSGSGTGMMTVVKTHFLPLGDSLSDSDSDSEVCMAL